MTTDRPPAPSPALPGPTVYLLHFHARCRHAGHYLGWTADRAGRGARLIEVVTAAGIDFTVPRTWPGDRDLERRLKRRKGSPRLCPICRAGQLPSPADPSRITPIPPGPPPGGPLTPGGSP